MNAKARIKQLERHAPKDAAKNAAKSIMQRVLDGEDVYEDEYLEYKNELGKLSYADNIKFGKQLLELYKDDTSDSHKRLEEFIRSEENDNK